jgi:UDP-N-acetylglucosamine 2-epimerase (hydrolysing)
MKRKILFLTGTRADFGKLKSLVRIIDESTNFEAGIFITGMHTLKRYGYTVDEIFRSLEEHRLKDGTRSVHVFHNQVKGEPMERVLANTIDGLSRYVSEFSPDLIVVHGDRVEALAGAIVGALRNILVAHIEGGEISGTIDELIRHAVTKMSHVHFVANEDACRRLLQLGESKESINIIGSPETDLFLSRNLPNINAVLDYYDIPFQEYAIVIFHSVTTDLVDTRNAVKALVDSIHDSGKNFVVIYPNNDEGCELIFEEYSRLDCLNSVKLIPSMRVEYFISLLKNSKFIIGNSSSGVRESPIFGIRSINISSRQSGRAFSTLVKHIDGSYEQIHSAIQHAWSEEHSTSPDYHYGDGSASLKFLEILMLDNFWKTSKQKIFVDVNKL